MVSEEFKEFKEFNGRLGERPDWIATKDDNLEGFPFARSWFAAIGQTMNFELFGSGVEMPGPELLELLNSLNSYSLHGSLADLEPSKDRTVCLYRQRMQESDGRRPF
jgi:hypothetical protein